MCNIWFCFKSWKAQLVLFKKILLENRGRGTALGNGEEAEYFYKISISHIHKFTKIKTRCIYNKRKIVHLFE